MATSEKDQAATAMAALKSIFDQGHIEVNGQKYVLTKMTHKQRRKVFAFYSGIGEQLRAKNFGFLDSAAFEPVESLIESVVLFDDMVLSKLPDHWDNYSSDYLPFIASVFPVICYPFLAGSHTA